MMVLLVFVKVPNRTVDPDARKSRARVTVNVESVEKVPDATE